MERTYIYLHGFASGPRSAKAQNLLHQFAQLHIPLKIPDLNQSNFTHLTLTRQLQQVAAILPSSPNSVTLIGSSLGGLTAAWLGQRHSQVEQLVLLAPAFEFLTHWRSQLGDLQMQQWQSEGTLSVYHHAAEKDLPLSYQFVRDAAQYAEVDLQRPVPTLILHGKHDEVIPIEASIRFAQLRAWVQLIELDSDHSLANTSDEIWQAIQAFCPL